MTDNISEKDKIDWKNFIKSKKKLENKDLKINEKKSKSTRLIDLHGFTLDKANIAIKDFINTSYKDGIQKLIVVTGKGLHSKNEQNPFVSKDLSILKYSVPDFINNNHELMKKIIEIKEADINDGGSGAFYVYLKKN
ncbi:Smr/MutS family protein [Candidatus Pelagibacter sp.]|nr:Smr/MutS family protein [Candidatus Pelagibacter sp.]